MKYENPFGDAIDQTVYWMWLFKKLVLKFWMTHLEVATAPVPVVQHPQNANADLKAEALSVAQMIRNGSYGRIPENFTLLWAEAKNAQQANQSYEQFVDHCNAEMTKAYLGQVLTTEGGGTRGSGSRALGDVHSDILAMRQEFSAHALESTLNTTLVRWLVDANYANVEVYPSFEFNLAEPPDLQALAATVKTLSDAGYKADAQYIEDTFGFKIQEKQTTVTPQLPIQPIQQGAMQ